MFYQSLWDGRGVRGPEGRNAGGGGGERSRGDSSEKKMGGGRVCEKVSRVGGEAKEIIQIQRRIIYIKSTSSRAQSYLSPIHPIIESTGLTSGIPTIFSTKKKLPTPSPKYILPLYCPSLSPSPLNLPSYTLPFNFPSQF